MELGQRLKQARLEAGLSQRQLCGDVITRNMLSQIENGSARPSMDTLQYLAAQLGKSVGYFLEGVSASTNQNILLDARAAYAAGQFQQVLSILETHQQPDELLDAEVYLLRCLSLISLAEQSDDPLPLLAQAELAGHQTPYFTPELARRIALCIAKNDAPKRVAILSQLSDEELLLRSAQAIAADSPADALVFLNSANDKSAAQWLLLRGDVAMAMDDLSIAEQHYLSAEALSVEAYPRLEALYLTQEDYQLAYRYACKQRK